MSRWSKVLQDARRNPKGVRFADLQGLIERVGYELSRVKGSHHVYTWPAGGLPIINVQPAGKVAKSYQVRQVLGIIDAYGLALPKEK